MSHANQHIDALLPLCRRGEQTAQLEVYNRYHGAMYNTALRIVKDPASAEDVMQDAFLKAFTKLESFKGDATFGSWLKRIVVNESLNAYQKEKKRAESPLEDHLYRIEDDSEGIPEDQMQRIQVQEVVQAMHQLKDNYRQCLSLHLIEGYDYDEMSSILEISYANCRTMVSRAKERLRTILKDSNERRYRTTI